MFLRYCLSKLAEFSAVFDVLKILERAKAEDLLMDKLVNAGYPFGHSKYVIN